MTPAARLSAAIAILDRILAGQLAEPALLSWSRASRFAGSGDRQAVRDLVFDALRRRRSAAALGGGETGRGLVLGLMRARGVEMAALFTGAGHAPAAITAADAGRAPEGNEALDCPDWLAPRLSAALGADFAPVMAALRDRAPVFLRANLARGARASAQEALAREGIIAAPVEGSRTALVVSEGARGVQTSQAYLGGLVELQDLSSQALVEVLPLAGGMKVLDYCAGGGGKTLAMAGLVAGLRLHAHDAAPTRMRDLPARTARAGVQVALADAPAVAAPYDLILCDAPCSGSGSWRRDPQGKWALTPARLDALLATQAAILDAAAPLVRPAGVLAYATCSILAEENAHQAAAFLARHHGWHLRLERVFSPLSGGDGFYLALFARSSQS